MRINKLTIITNITRSSAVTDRPRAASCHYRQTQR